MSHQLIRRKQLLALPLELIARATLGNKGLISNIYVGDLDSSRRKGKRKFKVDINVGRGIQQEKWKYIWN